MCSQQSLQHAHTVFTLQADMGSVIYRGVLMHSVLLPHSVFIHLVRDLNRRGYVYPGRLLVSLPLDITTAAFYWH